MENFGYRQALFLFNILAIVLLYGDIEAYLTAESMPAILTRTKEEEAGTATTVREEDFSCVWSPTDTSACSELLARRIPPPRPSLPAAGREGSGRKGGTGRRRWVVLGDSTMIKLFHWMMHATGFTSTSTARMISLECPCYACRVVNSHRCNLNSDLGLDYAAEWVSPAVSNFTMGEGPIRYGLQHPYCNDCLGCSSSFTVCKRHNHTNRSNNGRNSTSRQEEEQDECRCSYNGPWGGYFGIEFARDVEIQTPQYRTTQENILLLYWNTTFNSEQIVADFGSIPVCIVSAGIHDLGVNGTTIDRIVANVEWYLSLLMPRHCEHVVWLGLTCPLNEKFAQTKNNTMQLNGAIRDMILKRMKQRLSMESSSSAQQAAVEWKSDAITFIDPHNASIDYNHADNVHMAQSWYEQLGTFVAAQL